jgi:hypothetical protein
LKLGLLFNERKGSDYLRLWGGKLIFKYYMMKFRLQRVNPFSTGECPLPLFAWPRALKFALILS